MNILYIADPNSIHDQKWMGWFSEKEDYHCFLLYRKKHQTNEKLKGIEDLGGIDDFSVFKPWRNRRVKKRIIDICTQHRIDMIHIFYAEPNVLWALAFPDQIPIVLTTRGSDLLVGIKGFTNDSNLKNRILLRTYQRALDCCKAITSTSISQANFLKENFVLSVTPQIVRTGIDLSAIKLPMKERDVIFFPRNMEPLYNHELALAAIGKLPELVKARYRFVFVGKDGSNKAYIQKIQMSMLEISNVRIEFLNTLRGDAYFEMLSNSELVVMTPMSDGSPVSAMEALAAGCKLILPDLDYEADIFGAARFYTADNPRSLGEAILEALEDKVDGFDNVSYLEKVDRSIEMTKVQRLYDELSN